MNRERSLCIPRRNIDYTRNRNSSMIQSHNNRPIKNQNIGTSARKIITNYYRI